MVRTEDRVPYSKFSVKKMAEISQDLGPEDDASISVANVTQRDPTLPCATQFYGLLNDLLYQQIPYRTLANGTLADASLTQ